MLGEPSVPDLDLEGAPAGWRGENEDTESIISDLQRPRIPDFNFFDPLVSGALDYLEGASSLEEILAFIDEADLQIGGIRQAFMQEQRFQEESPQLDKIYHDVELMFLWLGQEFPALSEALKLRDQRGVALALLKIRDALETILVAFSRVKELQRASEQFSESPYLQELCRVGYAVMAGRLAPELFQERLQPYVRMHDAFAEQMESYAPAPSEAPVWDEVSEAFFNALDRCGEALMELELYSEDKNPGHLDRGLGRLRGATSELMDIQLRLASVTPPVAQVPCPVCSALNPAEASRCTACGATLHLVEDLGVPGTESSASGIGPNLQKFVELLRSAIHEEVSTEEVTAAFEAQQRNLDQVLAFFEQLPAQLPDEGDAEERDSVEGAREALNRALANIEEALHIVRDSLENGNLAQLQGAVGLIVASGDYFDSVESLGEGVLATSSL